MTRPLSPQEFAAVSNLPSARRYEHFIKQIVDTEQLWGLGREGGWVMARDGEGRDMLPVWPHAIYAEACAIEEWAGCTPEAIPLDEWIEAWLPGLEADGRVIIVFPLPVQPRGAVVSPARLALDLAAELENYE